MTSSPRIITVSPPRNQKGKIGLAFSIKISPRWGDEPDQQSINMGSWNSTKAPLALTPAHERTRSNPSTHSSSWGEEKLLRGDVTQRGVGLALGYSLSPRWAGNPILDEQVSSR